MCTRAVEGLQIFIVLIILEGNSKLAILNPGKMAPCLSVNYLSRQMQHKHVDVCEINHGQPGAGRKLGCLCKLTSFMWHLICIWVCRE